MLGDELMLTFNKRLEKLLHSTLRQHDGLARFLIHTKGKQIRPMLSLLCAKACGEPTDKSYRSALVAEMIHLASLLHDDVIDCSSERRGSPSVNAIWGNRVAVLLGDIISMVSLDLVLKNGEVDTVNTYVNAVRKLVFGELDQLKVAMFKNPVENDYLNIIEGKTASLFEAACKAGAMSTSNDQKIIDALGNFGKNLGIAFQIRDDLFGYDSFDVGKPVHNDFIERKLTLPIIYAMRKLGGCQRVKLTAELRLGKMSRPNIDRIIDTVKAAGGVSYATARLENYIEIAINSLMTLPASPVRDEIELLARSIIRRTS